MLALNRRIYDCIYQSKRHFHASFSHHSKVKKRIPSSHLIGNDLPLPAFIRAKDLAKKLGIDIDRVEKFAREENLAFNKTSEIILSYPMASKFVSSYNIKPVYEEVDAIKSDYWDCARKHRKFPTRPSVISVMGEIDHGKTTLLDALSDSKVADFEPGKITQSLSAFTVDLDPMKNENSGAGKAQFDALSPSRVTFLDTPGHDAFDNMRKNGAFVSDFLLLVISATEGVKKRTLEIIKMAKQQMVPIVVAINKIDIASEENIKNVYKQLRELGVSRFKRSKNPVLAGKFNQLFEDVSEDYPVVAIVEISAALKTNMDVLKRVIKELHECMSDNLHVDPNTSPAEATVIESYSTPGLGKVMLLVTHLGTIKLGSHFVVDKCIGSIKTLRIADARHLALNENTKSNQEKNVSKEILEGSLGQTIALESAAPGLPILVSGLRSDQSVPPGATLFQFDDKEKAEAVMQFRELLMEFRTREAHGTLYRTVKPNKKSSFTDAEEESADINEEELEDNFDHDETELKEEQKKNLSVIFKADNQGRLDAVISAAQNLARELGYELKILVKGLGDLTTRDLSIAQIENEENGVPRIPFYLFNVSSEHKALQWMSQNTTTSSSFQTKEYSVFLDILNDLKKEVLMKESRRLEAIKSIKKSSVASQKKSRPTQSTKSSTSAKYDKEKQKQSSRSPMKKRN